jgi:hypothetical protein
MSRSCPHGSPKLGCPVICKAKLPFRRSYSRSARAGFLTGNPHKTNGLELNPKLWLPSSRLSRTWQQASVTRSFRFETTSFGAIAFSTEPALAMELTPLTLPGDALRATAFCNPHLTSAPAFRRDWVRGKISLSGVRYCDYCVKQRTSAKVVNLLDFLVSHDRHGRLSYL